MIKIFNKEYDVKSYSSIGYDPKIDKEHINIICIINGEYVIKKIDIPKNADVNKELL